MLNKRHATFFLLIVAALFSVAYANPGSEWITLSSDSKNVVKDIIKSEVEKRDSYSTSQEEAANLKSVEDEKAKEDAAYKRAIDAANAEFTKAKKQRDDVTIQFQSAATDIEEFQKNIETLKSTIVNFDNQTTRYEQDTKAQEDSLTKWLKTEKQAEVVVAVIYNRGFKDTAHELDSRADTVSMPLMAEKMRTFVRSFTMVVNNTVIEDFIKAVVEGTAKWTGEEPLRIQLANTPKGTVYLRIKRYELYPFQHPDKVWSKDTASDTLKAAVISSMSDLDTLLSQNGYTTKNLDLSRIADMVNESAENSKQADDITRQQVRSIQERITRLQSQIKFAKSDKESQNSILQKKLSQFESAKADLVALQRKKNELDASLKAAQELLYEKKRVHDSLIIKTALAAFKGGQTPAASVAETIIDKLEEVKNDAKTQHSTQSATVMNNQLAARTAEQYVTDAKITGIRLVSFINEGDSAKIKIAFRVKTVLSETAPSVTSGETAHENKTQETGVLKRNASDTGARNERFVFCEKTVKDTYTSLIWTRDANLGVRNWQGAFDLVKELNQQKYAGFSDWRFPNKVELESLTWSVYGKNGWELNQMGFYNVENWYWSSTSYGIPSDAWTVHMGNGTVGRDDKPRMLHVWPVRSGQLTNDDLSVCKKTEKKSPAKLVHADMTEEQATASSAGVAYTDPVTGMEFVLVKGGCYQMGNAFGDGNSDEHPVHEVCVDDYYIGKYEVTQGQWKTVQGNNPSLFSNCGDKCPVERVSWDGAQGFIRIMNQRTGKTYRLLTEAEWEYAARSGGKYEKWAGTSSESELGNYAWYQGNSDGGTHPVGQKKPNGLGIYDMSGNVWEWVQDIYSGSAYSSHSRNNPIYTGNGARRVLRGGGCDGYGNDPSYTRTTIRDYQSPGRRNVNLGFRLARTMLSETVDNDSPISNVNAKNKKPKKPRINRAKD